MTQDELWNQIAIVHDSFRRIYFDQKLLDIALELSDSFSEENYDRICLLLECFKSRLENEADGLNWALDKLEVYLTATKTEQDCNKTCSTHDA